MATIKRHLVYLTLTIIASLNCQAQLRYNVYVTNDKGIALENVIVYSFALRKNAESAYKEGLSRKDEGYLFNTKRHNVVDEGRTDSEGKCAVKAYEAGAIILDGGDCKQGLYHFKGPYYIDDYRNKADQTDYTIRLTLTGEDYGAKTDKKWKVGDEIKLKQLDKTAVPMMAEAGGGIERMGKNYIRIKRDIDIDGEYARDDARFVAFPIIRYLDHPDSVTYMPPTIVDGLDYARTTERRMSYDPSHDPLTPHHYDAGTHLSKHQSERILYDQWAHIKKGTSYRIPGIIWYQDHNGVYHQDSLLFSDGREREPMRFLNWESARTFADLDRTKYLIQGDFTAIPMNESFKIGFDVGKATVNFSDSLTASEHAKMLSWLQGHYDNENGAITKIIVRGYSSPEGSEATNRRLSQERAATIIQTLRARYPKVGQIVPSFDNYDNIVPWDAIADTMMLADDSISRSYAQEIKTLIQGKTTITEQNTAVRSNPTLYDYVKEKDLLSRMRRVEIEANIIEQRVLTQDEIVQKYAQDSTFRTRMAPYQYYLMMCHLADIEDWDELYKVSKEAYAKAPKKSVTKQLMMPVTKDSLGIKYTTYEPQYVQNVPIPYPLAGYYYALSTMRKGLVDTDILKPYLDDGRVNRGGKDDMNNLAFIVAQVLMYCQDESFDGANALIKKYNLMSQPSLTGLVMFVRCLDGQYAQDPAVRDYVMSTSEMNKAVILAAIGKFREALHILYNGDVPHDDPKVEYLKAICHFRMQNSRITSPDNKGLSPSYIWSDDDPDEAPQSGVNTNQWAAPMLQAFRLDPANIRYIKSDGYFNDAYRQLVLYFWHRMQSGVPQDKIAAEYNMLRQKIEQENKADKENKENKENQQQ